MDRVTALRRLVAPTFVACLIALFGAAPATAAKAPKRSSSCSRSVVSFDGSEAEPTELPGPLEASILGSFAVFRRAAQPSDQPPVLNSAGNDLDYELSGYYPTYVRQLLRLPDGGRYFVIPAIERSESVPPARCLPRSLRSRRPKLVEEQRKRASEPVYCIVQVGGGSGAGDPECVPFAQVDEGVRVFLSAFIGGPTVDLVPDGVASVRVVYRTGAPIVATVEENAFLFSPPSALTRRIKQVLNKIIDAVRPVSAEHPATDHIKVRVRRLQKRLDKAIAEAEPTRIEWLDGRGGLLRSISPPSKGGGAPGSLGIVTFGGD